MRKMGLHVDLIPYLCQAEDVLLHQQHIATQNYKLHSLQYLKLALSRHDSTSTLSQRPFCNIIT